MSREMLGFFQTADGAATSGPGHRKPLVSYATGKDRGSRSRVLPAARLEQTLGDHLRVTLHGGDDTQDVRVLGRQGKVIVELVQTRCPLRGADGVCCHVRPQPPAPAPGTWQVNWLTIPHGPDRRQAHPSAGTGRIEPGLPWQGVFSAPRDPKIHDTHPAPTGHQGLEDHGACGRRSARASASQSA